MDPFTSSSVADIAASHDYVIDSYQNTVIVWGQSFVGNGLAAGFMGVSVKNVHKIIAFLG